jgi:hypothetical protein
VYYLQKGDLVFSTVARRDARQAQLQTYLNGVTARNKSLRPYTSTDGPSLSIIVDYDLKAEADQVWADVQAMKDTADVTGGFMGYGSVAEAAGEVSASLGYRWWY